MKKFIFPILILLLGCSPKVDKIELYKTKYYVKSEIHIFIDINTYKDFFKGRESAFSYKRDHYFINLPRIDSIYSGEDIKIDIISWFGRDTTFYPQNGKIKITDIDNHKILLITEFKDSTLPELLNGEFTLCFKKLDSSKTWRSMIYEME